MHHQHAKAHESTKEHSNKADQGKNTEQLEVEHGFVDCIGCLTLARETD